MLLAKRTAWQPTKHKLLEARGRETPCRDLRAWMWQVLSQSKGVMELSHFWGGIQGGFLA